uniref:Zinc transporter ZIP1-like n=1 Tax=Saccoglossus kowalevskii TaxID=10224 RepID=A0ABM0GP13_SACKO|nr:PREDICTED: zinc transporter ZIP1-like [Saccoglossus kowalevskii]
MDDVMGAKTIALFGLLAEVLIFGFIPLVCVNAVRTQDRFSTTKRIISWLSCFAGGVFLATSLIHMLPEVRETLAGALEGLDVHTHFPLAEFLTGIGFFIILITEHFALMCHDSQAATPTTDRVEQKYTEETPLMDNKNDDEITVIPDRNIARERSTSISEAHQHIPESGSALRSVLFLLALSLHSIFEGMAVGLQSDVSSTLELFIAIALHKGVVAFSFSLNLIQSKLSKVAMVMSIITFAVMSPIGVAIGMAASAAATTGPEALFANGFLQGLATGTFLYITFFEILPHELNERRDGMIKVLWILLGYAVMTIINLSVPHEH